MSARPVIHSINYDSPVDKINAGLVVPTENPKAITEAILKIKSMTQKERNEMGANGRVYGLKNQVRSGADKISINSIAYQTTSIVNDIAKLNGSQCVKLSIDA